MSLTTESRVSGPARKRIAHRVVKVMGGLPPVLCITNWRLPRPEISGSIAPMSTPPAAESFPPGSRLVALGLEPPDHPGAGVGHRLVVEVHRVLGGGDEPDTEGPGLLEQGEDRFLRGGSAVGGQKPNISSM